MPKPPLSRKSSEQDVRISELKKQGLVGEMIVNALQAPMTPDQLVMTLMNEPYNLSPTEENLAEITRILNSSAIFKVAFKRTLGCFSIRTELHL